MHQNLKIGLFQFDILWEDIEGNNRLIYDRLNSLGVMPDLIFLPEMYSTGFTMQPEKLNQKLLMAQSSWQQNLSNTFNVGVLGSFIQPEGEKYKNRLHFSLPTTAPGHYDKRHLFHLENSFGNFIPGNSRECFKYNGIKLMPQICYDLRFPVWARNDQNYQVLFYVANWPASRQHVWRTLLMARAIENQCFVVGVNRIGTDNNNIDYTGGSVVFNAKGESLIELGDKEQYMEVSLSMKELHSFKEKFPVYKDWDKFILE
jgi:predicted amidohydrolase